MTEQDKILWQKVKNDHRPSFDTLYHQTIDFIAAYGYRFTEDRAVVEETLQEVYIHLWKKRKTIEIHSSFKFYLLRSFRRRLLKKQQQKKKHPILNFDANLLSSPSYETQWIELEEKNARSTQLKEATKALSPRQQEALFLKFYQYLESAEIAEIMGLQVGAVYKLISTGLRRLREQF